DRHAIRFTSATELVWELRGRSPGVDSRSGTRYKYALTPGGKLELTTLAILQSDGLEWDPLAGGKIGRKPPPLEYTIIPLDKKASSFQLVRVDTRGRKVLDAVFRQEAEVPRLADPFVSE